MTFERPNAWRLPDIGLPDGTLLQPFRSNERSAPRR